jgi:hypothetical protein
LLRQQDGLCQQLNGLRGEEEELEAQIKQKVEVLAGLQEEQRALWSRIRMAQRLVLERESESQRNWNCLRDLEDASEVLRELDGLKGRLARQQEREAELGVALRRVRTENKQRLSVVNRYFNALLKLVADEEAEGDIGVSGRGLELSIVEGDIRSSTAIGMLKVLLFDLASMVLAAKGKTFFPAFLIHDSPREADLGLGHYHAIFEAVCELEGASSGFQYIITTTTAPPEGLKVTPWLRLRLQGHPAQERLLGVSLV